MIPRNQLDYVLGLHERGLLCVPVVKGGRHLAFEAMGRQLCGLHKRNKSLRELAITGTLFGLAQQPPAAETLVRWFEHHDGNIGIVGGYRDLLILDFDHPDLFEQVKRRNHTLFESTPIERTPNGYHVYLKSRTPCASSSLHYRWRRGGHIKALGGYVVAGPSKMDSGATYRWIDDQSPFDVSPQTIDSPDALSIHPHSYFKRRYDNLTGRRHTPTTSGR